MMPQFPFTEVKDVKSWTNYSGSLPERRVPIYCTPDVLGESGSESPRKLMRHGEALRGILEHCFGSPASSCRTIGSRWSFSNIVEPEILLVDPINMNTVLKVRESWVSRDYRQKKPAGRFIPVFVQGGTQVGSLNRRLLETGLALQTSGAGDGQLVAGALSTGTHGSALNIGAMHDTVLGIHLIVGPNDSVFIQPSSAALGAEFAGWLAEQTGIPTRNEMDDELFAAAQVSLGSLGFIHGVVVETVPIYSLHGRIVNRAGNDADVWETLEDWGTQRFHPDVTASPYHFEIVLQPYPDGDEPGAFVKMLWKGSGDDAPHDSPLPSAPALSSDVMGLIAHLSGAIDIGFSTPIIRKIIGEQLRARYSPRTIAPSVPGMLFGPTSLPPGNGASTEVVVSSRHIRQALELLMNLLRTEASDGRHLLGAIGIRFNPGTNSLLGMNQDGRSCYVELPSIRNSEVLGIYKLWWNALQSAGIAFGCHWGQDHGMDMQRVQTYYGGNVERWQAARNRILPSADAKRVFASQLAIDLEL